MAEGRALFLFRRALVSTLAPLAMKQRSLLALLGLLAPVEKLLQSIFGRERRPVDAREGFVVLLAASVRRRGFQ